MRTAGSEVNMSTSITCSEQYTERTKLVFIFKTKNILSCVPVQIHEQVCDDEMAKIQKFVSSCRSTGLLLQCNSQIIYSPNNTSTKQLSEMQNKLTCSTAHSRNSPTPATSQTMLAWVSTGFHNDDDDDDGWINFNVAYSPKTARTRNS